MTQICRLAVIIGSVRKDRVGPIVARWLLGQIRPHIGIQLDLVDLVDLELPDDLDNGGDAVMFRKRIDSADGFIVVTPEYNRGYPGALKTAIDTAVTEWHAVTMQAVVSVPFVWERMDEHGDLCPPDRTASAAATLLRQLTWWAQTLRQARAHQTYQP
jgi:NAD(P)H-dependent FMN reductase